MTDTTPPPDTPSKRWTHGGMLLLVAVGLVSIISDNEADYHAGDNTPSAEFMADEEIASASTHEAIATPSKDQLAKATGQIGRVVGALGPDGAVFYSEHCYEAIERAFLPQSLDRCYAFDVLAQRLMEEGDITYFYPRFWPANARSRWDQAVLDESLSQAEFAQRRNILEKEIESAEIVLIEPPTPRALATNEVGLIDGDLIDDLPERQSASEPDLQMEEPGSSDFSDVSIEALAPKPGL